MNHCYLCGRPLKSGSTLTRRKVRTGEWLRKTYRAKKVSSINVHFGGRILCRVCAKRLDREAWMKELKVHLPELLILVGILLAILLR